MWGKGLQAAKLWPPTVPSAANIKEDRKRKRVQQDNIEGGVSEKDQREDDGATDSAQLVFPVEHQALQLRIVRLHISQLSTNDPVEPSATIDRGDSVHQEEHGNNRRGVEDADHRPENSAGKDAQLVDPGEWKECLALSSYVTFP